MKHNNMLAFTLLAGLSFTASAQNPCNIRVNQVGYLPGDSKTAAIEEAGWARRYSLIDTATGRKVWQGKAVRTATSPWSGKQRAIVDFSKVTTPGTYTLTNGKESERVIIADGIYHDLAIASAKAFYLLRSGEAIDRQYAGDYARPLGHPDTRVMVHPSAVSPSRPAGTILSCPGGWYDAGDYNKYIVNSAYSVALMMDAYEMNANYYNHLALNIPESANATPDLLDEIAVNLRWMLTMQDPDDGGVYHKLTTPNFEPFIMPTACKQQRYVVKKTTAAAYDFAAAMAKAYRIYSRFPAYREWAEQVLEQSKRAYEWAEAHPNIFYRQNEMNESFDPDVTTGAYDDSSLTDEQLWAQVELYIATGDNSYVRQLMNGIESLTFHTPSWAGVTGLAIYSAVSATKEGSVPYSAEIQSYLRPLITKTADDFLATMPTSCYDSPYGNTASDFAWGCNAEQGCSKGIAMLYAHALTGDAKYIAGAKKVADYILGRNATGYCYVTGFGTFSPQHPHQRLSEADGIEAPLPGFLVGGPNPGQQDIKEVKHYPSDYPDESYSDTTPSYASNEIAINWNAAAVALFGWLDALEQR